MWIESMRYPLGYISDVWINDFRQNITVEYVLEFLLVARNNYKWIGENTNGNKTLYVGVLYEVIDCLSLEETLIGYIK